MINKSTIFLFIMFTVFGIFTNVYAVNSENANQPSSVPALAPSIKGEISETNGTTNNITSKSNDKEINNDINKVKNTNSFWSRIRNFFSRIFGKN